MSPSPLTSRPLFARLEAETTNVSALGAVMAFLYSTYIITYAVASPLLGRNIDRVYNQTGGSNGGDIHSAIRNTAGVQCTIIMAGVLSSTVVPRCSLAFNPAMLDDQVLGKDIDYEPPEDGRHDEKDRIAALQHLQAEERRDSVTCVSADINDTFPAGLPNVNGKDQRRARKPWSVFATLSLEHSADKVLGNWSGHGVQLKYVHSTLAVCLRG